MKLRFLTSCVNWPRYWINDLHEMIDNARDITRQTFMKHVGYGTLKQHELQLGYAWHPKIGLTMAGDWHVSYHKSKLNGHTVYYFRQSSIEYVFVPDNFKWSRHETYPIQSKT